MGVFVVTDDGQLVEMLEQPYALEEVLQKRLAQYPNLLVGDKQESPGGKRFILVKREATIPFDEGVSHRWSVDHLFLDEEGVPTLVEVKRSKNTQVRREVVGQMLDYAANAVAYWPIERIRTEFAATCSAQGADSDELLRALLTEEEDTESFWLRVKTNLDAGRLRMVFVADEIPSELKRIVEYLNNQMKSAEVLAIEVKEYAGEGMTTLVSSVIGQTAAAQQAKSVGEPGPKEKLYRDFWSQFLLKLHEHVPGWTKAQPPWKATWIELPAGRTSIYYSANFPATKRLRVELYVDPSSPQLRERAYTELEAKRGEIESQFGERLNWEPLPGKRASRIATYAPWEATIEEQERWPEYEEWLLMTLPRFRDAVQPAIDAL